MKKRILYVGNYTRDFYFYRLALAKAARGAGYEVHVAMPDGKESEQIRAEGFPLHIIPLNRKSAHIGREIITIKSLYNLYRSVRPDLVHHHTIKPVIYGSLIARVTKVPAVVSSVTGLGYVFVSKGWKARLLKKGVMLGYRIAFGHKNLRIIFQNPDDQTALVKSKVIDKKFTTVIRGSGVDVKKFSPTIKSSGAPTIVFTARMLWDKGIGEYVEAAKCLRRNGVKAKFALVGGSDAGNPASVEEWQLKSWHDSGAVEWWGRHDDMPAIYEKADIACLPSYYGEGVPRCLIEAAACGLPIVTTDMPGCREVVKHGENGLLVPPKDHIELAGAIHKLIENQKMRLEMGRRGRSFAENEFSAEIVIAETLSVYKELLQ